MRNWIKFIVVLIVCVVSVGSVYIWKFGLPAFLSREERYMKLLYSNIVLEENIEVKLQDKSIVFTRSVGEEVQTVQFDVESGVVSTAMNDGNISEDFKSSVIKSMFMAAVKLNEQSEENAIYSLIPDIISDKTLSKDGYSLTSQNGVTRFNMKINQKFNLANGQEVYIKVSDIQKIEDVIKYKLQNKIIEKPGIVLEKSVSYSNNLVFIIYEKEKLTDRTYNSFVALITTLLKDKAEYVKTNYPSITRAGTLTLDGVIISMNEAINENNIHSYKIPEGYEYMVIRIDINEVER